MRISLPGLPPEAIKAFQSVRVRDADPMERAKRDAAELNAKPGTLQGCDCPVCLNRGFTWEVDSAGSLFARECVCKAERRSLRALRESGLGDMAERCTFRTWRADEEWQQSLLEMARQYAKEPKGWFFLAGSPGTGKTHLCAAICRELIHGGMPGRYLLWRDFSVQAKALVNDGEAYQALIEPYKRVKLLYIDDLFKTARGREPTTGDVNLAFELLNHRYLDERKLTVLSSELTLARLLRVDEALGSRVFQRAGGNYADLSGMRNYRLGA